MTLSGRITVELNPPQRELTDLLRAVERLDGEGRFSVVLFPLPTGARLDDIELDSYRSGYLQCAGSRDRLTLELREDVAGSYHQYILARTEQIPDDEARRTVRWHTFENLVHEQEIFTVADATEPFAEYLRTGSVPERFHRRPLLLPG